MFVCRSCSLFVLSKLKFLWETKGGLYHAFIDLTINFVLYTCFLDILVKNENWIAGDQLEGFITFHIWMPICFWGVLLQVEYLCLLELNLLFDVEAQPFSSRYTNLQCAYWDKAEYQPINYTPHRFTTVFSQNSTHPFIFTYYSHEPRHLILSTF